MITGRINQISVVLNPTATILLVSENRRNKTQKKTRICDSKFSGSENKSSNWNQRIRKKQRTQSEMIANSVLRVNQSFDPQKAKRFLGFSTFPTCSFLAVDETSKDMFPLFRTLLPLAKLPQTKLDESQLRRDMSSSKSVQNTHRTTTCQRENSLRNATDSARCRNRANSRLVSERKKIELKNSLLACKSVQKGPSMHNTCVYIHRHLSSCSVYLPGVRSNRPMKKSAKLI